MSSVYVDAPPLLSPPLQPELAVPWGSVSNTENASHQLHLKLFYAKNDPY